MLDDIGHFGSRLSPPAKKLILYINTFLISLVLMLWIFGMVAWSENMTTLSNFSWGYANYKYEIIAGIGSFGAGEQSHTTIYQEVFAGLQGYYGIKTASGETTAFKAYVPYASCNDIFCNSCVTSGQLAVGLLVISFFISIVLILISFMRIYNDTSALKVTALLTTAVIWIFSVSSYSAFINLCVSSVNKDLRHINMQTYHGFSIVVTGWVLTTFIFVIHLCLSTDGEDSRLADQQYKDEVDSDDEIEFVVRN